MFLTEREREKEDHWIASNQSEANLIRNHFTTMIKIINSRMTDPRTIVVVVLSSVLDQSQQEQPTRYFSLSLPRRGCADDNQLIWSTSTGCFVVLPFVVAIDTRRSNCLLFLEHDWQATCHFTELRQRMSPALSVLLLAIVLVPVQSKAHGLLTSNMTCVNLPLASLSSRPDDRFVQLKLFASPQFSSNYSTSCGRFDM